MKSHLNCIDINDDDLTTHLNLRKSYLSPHTLHLLYLGYMEVGRLGRQEEGDVTSFRNWFNCPGWYFYCSVSRLIQDTRIQRDTGYIWGRIHVGGNIQERIHVGVPYKGGYT